MKKKYRVRRNFARILKNKIYSEGGLSVFAAPGTGRIGIAVVKTVKGAVKRNRVKRQLREYARKNLLGKTKRKDIIVVAASETFRKPKEIKLG